MEGDSNSFKLEDIGTVEFLKRLKGKRADEDEDVAKDADKYVDNVILKPFRKKPRDDFLGPMTLGTSLQLREDFYAYAYLYQLRRAYFFEQDYYGDDSDCDSDYDDPDKLAEDRD